MTEVTPIANPTSYTISYSRFTPGPPGGVKSTYTSTVSATTTNIVLSLAANFIPLPLCNPLLGTKYQVGLSNCVTITDCVLATLYAYYCADEGKALSCVDNYFMSTSQTCIAGCTAGVPRSPGSNKTNGICNYTCTNTQNCPSNSLAQMSDFQSNYKCSATATRINYKCLNLVPSNGNIENIINKIIYD